MSFLWNLVKDFCFSRADPYESDWAQRSRPTLNVELDSNKSNIKNYAYTFQYNEFTKPVKQEFAPRIHYETNYYDKQKYAHDSLKINKLASPNSKTPLYKKSDTLKKQKELKNSNQLEFLSGKKVEIKNQKVQINRAKSLFPQSKKVAEVPKTVFANRIDPNKNQKVQINRANSLFPQSKKVAEVNEVSDNESDNSTEYKKEKFKSFETYFKFFKDNYGFRFRDINNPKELFEQLANKMKWRKKPEHFSKLKDIKSMNIEVQEYYLIYLCENNGYIYNKNLNFDENYEKFSENMGWNPYKKRT